MLATFALSAALHAPQVQTEPAWVLGGETERVTLTVQARSRPTIAVEAGAIGDPRQDGAHWTFSWELPPERDPRRWSAVVWSEDGWAATSVAVARRAVFRVRGPGGSKVTIVGDEQSTTVGDGGEAELHVVVQPGRSVRAVVSHDELGFRHVDELVVPDPVRVWATTGPRIDGLTTIYVVALRDSGGAVHGTASMGGASIRQVSNGRFEVDTTGEGEQQVTIDTDQGRFTAQVMIPPEPARVIATPDARPVRARAQAGVEVSLSGVAGPACIAGLEYGWFWDGGHRLALATELGATWLPPHSLGDDTLSDEENRFASAWAVPVLAWLRYAYEGDPWSLWVGAGSGVLIVRGTEEIRTPQRVRVSENTEAAWQLGAEIGVSVALGAGALSLLARFSPVPLRPAFYTQDASRFGVYLGYGGTL